MDHKTVKATYPRYNILFHVTMLYVVWTHWRFKIIHILKYTE